ncbi:MAG: hypothetical protein LBQ66_00570 [Planctomycetaceae bacterium]|nr:hypothetical protein [Planctomycetaceae bacterium]
MVNRCFFPPQLSASTPTQPPGGRLPTLRLPTCLGVQFQLVRFYYAQRRAGRPRSSPRRFAAIVGYADNWGVLVLSMRVPPQLSACADVTARRSVTHLTFVNPF